MPETNLDRLIRRQHETWSQMQAIYDHAEAEGRSMSAEESARWDAANAELNQIDTDLERARTMAERSTVDRSQIMNTGGPDPADPTGQTSGEERRAEYRTAFGAYVRRRRLTDRQHQLLEGNHEEFDSRALGGATDAAGGYLVPDDFWNRIQESQKAYGGVINYCNVITTSGGAPLPWPANDDTGNEGALLAENTEMGEQDLTFTGRQLGAYVFTSKVVRVPWALLNDSAFDIEGLLARRFGQRLGRVESRYLISGTGVGQPTGILTGMRTPVVSPVGATQTLTFDNTVDLEHSVDPAYRGGGNARYMLQDKALAIFRKVKDADGRPIWQPIPGPGFPATINGFPYFVDNSMLAPAAGGIAAVFGDFEAGMVVRKVQGIQSVRMDEMYARFLQSGFFAYERMDAVPDDSQALAALKFGNAS